METVRKIINVLFWIVFIGGLAFLLILLIGGAFPINWGTSGQTVKFDVARIGWETNDPSNGTFTIVHDQQNIKEGWGALQYDYKYKEKPRPGFHSKAYTIEGLINLNFWMKARKPCIWRVQIQRKSDNKIFYRTFRIGTKWKEYNANIYEMRDEARYKGRFSKNDLKKWVNFVDITNQSSGANTIWIDNIVIMK